MLLKMDDLLLDLPLLTIGAHCLVVGAVPLSVPLDVDGCAFVVFIFDTTCPNTILRLA
jgi:hypothetical protein